MIIFFYLALSITLFGCSFPMENEISSSQESISQDSIVEKSTPIENQTQNITNENVDKQNISMNTIDASQSKIVSANSVEIELPKTQNEILNYQTYRVQKNDTLMIIAFKIYGDIEKWTELKKLNPHVKTNEQLRNGDAITFLPPTQEFKWKPFGLPYLIKQQDTLSSIALEKYFSANKWKKLYQENKPLIKNPNKIYAGFTIYYENMRRPASKKTRQ